MVCLLKKRERIKKQKFKSDYKKSNSLQFSIFNLPQVDACLAPGGGMNGGLPLGSIGSSLGWSPPEGNSIWGKANPTVKSILAKDVSYWK